MKPEDKWPYIFVSFWEAMNKFDSFEFSFVKLKPINVSVKGSTYWKNNEENRVIAGRNAALNICVGRRGNAVW
jgi:hypothetical protein